MVDPNTLIYIYIYIYIILIRLLSICIADSVCDTEFATDMTFKVVTSIFNFYIPTACMVFLNARIFLAIKRRTKDIEQFGAYTATGGASARPAARKPKAVCDESTIPAPPGACGIRTSKELPMTNIAEAMHRASTIAGKRCTIIRKKWNNSSGSSWWVYKAHIIYIYIYIYYFVVFICIFLDNELYI